VLCSTPGCRRGGEGASPGERSVRVHVLVPCGLASVFARITVEAQEDLPDVHLTSDIVPVVAMTDRVLNGSLHADLFTSLGYKEIERLQRAGKLVRGSVRNMARFELCLATAAGNPLGVKDLHDLLKPEVKHVTMPPPHENSVGCYTRDVLKKAGLWEALDPKIVYPASSAQVPKYLRKGWADAAVVYDTCLIETYTPTGEPKGAKGAVEKVAMIDPALYPTMYAPAALLKGSKHPRAARRVLDYLVSDAVADCFRQHGFKPLAPSRGGARDR